MIKLKMPIIVDGFRLGYDDEPEWFKKSKDNRDIIPFDKGVFVATELGKIFIEEGYCILRGADGELYICSYDILKKIIGTCPEVE